MENLKIEMKSEYQDTWEPTTLEYFYQVIAITRDILQQSPLACKGVTVDDYSDKRALWSIRAGKTVSTPILEFRLAEGTECPKCNAKFIGVAGALSRRDNRTMICSPCGAREAYEDMTL
jgi:hypothetical protein